MRVFSKRIRIAALALLAVYVGTYCLLTRYGRYEAGDWGINGPKSYQWAPWGFVDKMGDTPPHPNRYPYPHWKTPPLLVFLPLWEADRFLWHTRDLATSGRYPANLDEERPKPEQDGAANRSQPARPDTNQPPAAAGSGR